MAVVLKTTCRLAGVLLALFVLSGCGGMARRVFLADDVWVANRRFKQGSYGLALAKYQRLIDQYPEGRLRQRLYLKRGACLYNDQVQSLPGAQAAYLDYLADYPYPAGRYRQEADDQLERIRAIRANRENSTDAVRNGVQDDVAQLRAALEKHPYDDKLYLRLGNALWQLERYEQAAQAYVKGQQINAALKEYDWLQKRLMVDEQGNVRPVTPVMQRQIERERNPIVIFDLNEYYARLTTDQDASRLTHYNVIGKARNQSSRRLRGVVVEVSFYNPARKLLDVQQAAIGDLPPGAVRVFRVKSDNYDNIYNILKYECRAYER
ncbi:FxLYD domain-containing protein [Candidatus Sumerlaeota bacterium]